MKPPMDRPESNATFPATSIFNCLSAPSKLISHSANVFLVRRVSDMKRKSHGIYNENMLSTTTKVKSIKDNHLHTYFGTSAVISMEAFSEIDILALLATCPSTKTFPAKDRIPTEIRQPGHEHGSDQIWITHSEIVRVQYKPKLQ